MPVLSPTRSGNPGFFPFAVTEKPSNLEPGVEEAASEAQEGSVPRGTALEAAKMDKALSVPNPGGPL